MEVGGGSRGAGEGVVVIGWRMACPEQRWRFPVEWVRFVFRLCRVHERGGIRADSICLLGLNDDQLFIFYAQHTSLKHDSHRFTNTLHEAAIAILVDWPALRMGSLHSTL